jgi:hypothetical protein
MGVDFERSRRPRLELDIVVRQIVWRPKKQERQKGGSWVCVGCAVIEKVRNPTSCLERQANSDNAIGYLSEPFFRRFSGLKLFIQAQSCTLHKCRRIGHGPPFSPRNTTSCCNFTASSSEAITSGYGVRARGIPFSISDHLIIPKSNLFVARIPRNVLAVRNLKRALFDLLPSSKQRSCRASFVRYFCLHTEQQNTGTFLSE